jgi:dipeptidyl aminopeptidase/acylaminoacyl peptidase
LAYVRPGLPPIIRIQGDADPLVPYNHSVRLQEVLEKAGVPHQLVTITGGKHGNFTAEEYVNVYSEIRAFLAKFNLVPN